jgi:peptidoglycan/LPS O-acetylase OafA/YrhL
MIQKNGLTSFRFIAAFMVVGSHFFKFTGVLEFLNPIFIRGYLGVEFFFILLRIARIAPAYYFAIILAGVTLYSGLKHSEFLKSHALLFITPLPYSVIGAAVLYKFSELSQRIRGRLTNASA